MAIAFDAASQDRAAAASSLTFSHTISGNNTLLVVSASSSENTSPSGVTFNGVAMTLIDSQANSSSQVTTLWYLIAPADGAHDIVITSIGEATELTPEFDFIV